jgi:ubiquinone/menaquinone biosynthesis C-methylase UbiE
MSNQTEWQTKSLAAAFLEGVRGALPGADLQMDVIRKIVQMWCPEPRGILDLGCGDGAIGRMLMEAFPSARAVFVDFSEPMLDALRSRLDAPGRADVVLADFGSREWLDQIPGDCPLDVLVSGFAIHHQPDERKRQLYGEIYHLLEPSGVFLNMEHVASATPEVQSLFDEYFIDRLFSFHTENDPQKTRQEIAGSYYHRPDKAENILAPVGKQCEWLSELGFSDVDCFFKCFELALFGGRKPPQ